MAGTISISLFPTGGALNASVLNTAPVSLLTEVNKHTGGTAYRHAISEIDTPVLDESITVTAVGVGVSTADVVALRHQTAMARMMGGSGNYATRYASLPTGADLTSLFANAGAYNAISNTTGKTALSIALSTVGRGIQAEVAFGSVDIGGAVTIPNGVAQLSVSAASSGQVLPMFTSRTFAGRYGIRSFIDSSVTISNSTDNAGMVVNGSITLSGAGSHLIGLADSATVAATAGAVPIGGITGAANPGDNGKIVVASGGVLGLQVFSSSLIGNRTISLKAISDLATSADGTTRVVTVGAGTYLAVNATPAIVQRTFNGSTVTVASPPTGARYTCIYLDNAGNLQQNPGADGGVQDTAPLPSGGYAVAWSWMPQNGTALYSTQAEWTAAGSPATKGYLIPQYVNGGSAGSGGGGGSFAPLTAPYGVAGSIAGLGLSANAWSITDWLGGNANSFAGSPTYNGVNLQTTAGAKGIKFAPTNTSTGNTATVHDTLLNTASGTYYTAVTVSGTTAILSLARGPVELGSNGDHRYMPNTSNTAPTTTQLTSTTGSAGTAGVGSASGGAIGVWTICADFASPLAGCGAPGFALTLVAPNQSTSGLVPLYLVNFDGTNFQPESLVPLLAPVTPGSNFRPRTVEMPQSVLTAVPTSQTLGTPVAMVGTSQQTLFNAVSMKGWIHIEGLLVQGATLAQVVYVGFLLDGAAFGQQVEISDVAVAAHRYFSFMVHFGVGAGNPALAPSGSSTGHTFQPYCIISSAAAGAQVSFANVNMYGEFHV